MLVAFPPAEVSVTDYPGATRGKWLLGHVCRLAVHLASLLVSFLVIVQEPTVIDIFKDFAAVQFVTKLSQVRADRRRTWVVSCGHPPRGSRRARSPRLT